jgi:hypothetical protein
LDLQQSPYSGQQRGVVAAGLFEVVGSCLAVGDTACNVENRFFVELSAGHGNTSFRVGRTLSA